MCSYLNSISCVKVKLVYSFVSAPRHQDILLVVVRVEHTTVVQLVVIDSLYDLRQQRTLRGQAFQATCIQRDS